MNKEETKEKITSFLDKVFKTSKDVIGKAGEKVQEASDKGVTFIEKKQYEDKKNKLLTKLGKLTLEVLNEGDGGVVSMQNAEAASIIGQIKDVDAEIAKRDEQLKSESDK